MKRVWSLRRIRAVAWVAGAMDTATGLALVAAPAWVLGWMRVPAVPSDAQVWLRWVGAFVGGVGICYLVALARGGIERLRAVLELTLVLRAAVGVFTAVSIAGGSLDPSWTSVPVTDLGLAALQGWWLVKGVWRHE